MITIFTPTYNRASTIFRTYESLKGQTCKDFEWLIVDDGSTDNTESLVQGWIMNSVFPVRYIKQPNGGKYRAYNNGLKHAKGELFFCVDSDDWLPCNAVERILSYFDKLRKSQHLAGIIALKEFQDKKIIGKPFSKANSCSSLYNLEVDGERGERTLVFKTSVAKMFPFPEETNEKFVTESVVYDRYNGKYEFIVTNDILTICEYQYDGLSSNVRSLMLRNPAGYKLYYSQRIDLTSSFFERVAYILRYHAFRLLYNGTAYKYCGNHKTLVSILSPLGFIVKIIYNRIK